MPSYEHYYKPGRVLDAGFGPVLPLASTEFDRGRAPPDFALRGTTLTVRRTAAQQSDLDRLLAAQRNPSSPNYRKWLTPEDFADRFGATRHALAKLRRGWRPRDFRSAVARTGPSFGSTPGRNRFAKP